MDPTDQCPEDDALTASETSSDTVPVPETATGDAAPFAVVAEGRLSFANSAFRSMFRLDNEITGMSLADLIAAQSRAAVEKLLADPAESFLTFPTLAVRSEGMSFPVELHLARRKYAHAAEHGEIHACLLQDLRCFSSGCDTRSLSLTLRFLQEWLLRHVATVDRELAMALRSLGFG